jgi:hypothetical protein
MLLLCSFLCCPERLTSDGPGFSQAWDGERFLIVMNFSEETSQALVRVPWDELRDKMWLLDDRLSGETLERHGNDMRDGLFVELVPWQCQLFQVRTV